jgi:hypothetical protein
VTRGGSFFCRRVSTPTNMKSFYPFLRIAALCLVVSIFFGCAKPVESEHKPKFYQSPMHPWIRSDKPGNCTICGMAEGNALSRSRCVVNGSYIADVTAAGNVHWSVQMS